MFFVYESLLLVIGFLGLYFFTHKKFKKKFYYLLMVLFGFFLCVSCPLYIGLGDDTNNNENQIEVDTISPKESGYLLIDHIEIDQNNALLTWEVTNQTNEWCTGSGTIDDPFIIENVSINAYNYDIGISISGSKGIYFVIKNSQISNASIGINLDTTDGGSIINNTISNNNDQKKKVFADKNMVKTVLRNLVSNAVNFTNNDGQVILESTLEGNELIIRVIDNGIGINSENIHKLFRIDEKVIGRTTEGGKGTGLGLILCREFIEKNGGNMWVESELSRGSTFSFSLPVIPPRKSQNGTSPLNVIDFTRLN